MDEKQLQFLYNEYAKGKGFKDFAEFSSLMNDEKSRRIFFDDSNKDLGFKDFADFDSTLGIKKKEPSVSSVTPSQLPKTDIYTEQLLKAGQPQISPTQQVKSDKYLDFGQPIAPTQPAKIQAVKPLPATDLPDIKEAIDNTVQQKIKEKRGLYDRTLPKPTKEEIAQLTELVTNAYKNGDLVPQLVDGKSVMKRGLNPIESFVNVVNVNHERELENNILSKMDKNDAINYLETERQLPPKEEGVPSSALGKVGKFLGENVPMLMKAGVGAVLGAETGLTGGASFGTFVSTVNDMARSGYSETLKRNYNLLKEQNPNISNEEAYDKANRAALAGEAISIGTGALLAGHLPFEVPKPTIPVKGVLDGISQSAKQAVKTSPRVIGGAALGTLINDIASDKLGAKIGAGQMEQDVLQTAKDMSVMHFGLWGLLEPSRIPSYIRPQVENVVASAPREQVANFYNQLEEAGKIPQGSTDKVLTKLSDFDKQKAVLQNMPLSEEQKAAMAGKLLQRNKLVEENKTLKSYGGSFQDRIETNDVLIEKLDRETNSIAKSKNVFSHETDNLTGEKATAKGEPEQITKPIELSTEITEAKEPIAEVKETEVVEPFVPKELSSVEETAKALEGVNTAQIEANLLSKIAGGRIIGKSANESISEAYHEAKLDGSNPELVKAVEELIGKKEQSPISEKVTTETKEPTGEGGGGKPPTKNVEEVGARKPESFRDKSILKRLAESENIKPETKEKFKQNLKYKVKSKEEARQIAKEIINEFGVDDAVTMAEAGKFHGDENSMIFAEALDQVYSQEQSAKTPQERMDLADKWAAISMSYDEAARSSGRFISAIQDFYKKSPLGVQIKEQINRNEAFNDWFKGKDKSYKEVFEAIKEEPEFKELLSKEVKEELKKERAEARKARIDKFDSFIDSAKFKKDALYAVPIPAEVINGALELIKKGYKAGEKAAELIENAVEFISDKIGRNDWDKDKFRKEWEEKFSKFEKVKKTDEELSEDKKAKLLDKLRKKLKGLDERQKEEVIRKSFKKIVESGGLEYDDFKKIIQETLGLGELSKEEKDKITNSVKDINAVEDFAEKARTVRTEQALNEFIKSAKKAEKSATELAQIVYNKPDIIKRLTSIMQLNTLSIPSLVNNPIFNVVNQAFVRFPKAVQLSILDQLIYGGGKLVGKEIKPKTNILKSQLPFLKGVGEGSKQSIEQLFTGLTNKDYFQKEVYASQIHPFTSLKELYDFGKYKLGLGGKRLTGTQALDKALQGTIGLPAEAVARMLNVGDKPQRFAAELAVAKVIADAYGLKGMDEKLFFSFPKEEAYRIEKAKGASDEEAMKKAEAVEKRIVEAGEESTFQRENLINTLITYAGKGFDKVAEGKALLEAAGKIGSVLRMANMPFVKIPLNAYWSYFNLVNPEVAMTQSLIYGSSAAYKRIKGIEGAGADLEQAKKWLAHATTGMAMLAATGMMSKAGIVKGDNNIKDTKKEREGEKTYEQQHSLNMNKLWAFLNGQDPNEVKEGLNVDLKWFGVLGNALNLQANKIEDLTAEQRKNGMSVLEDMGYNLKQSALEQFENGVFSNTASLFSALNNGGPFWDNYFMNLFNMGLNTFHPAMFAQFSRAQLPNDYTIRADDFMGELKNNLAARSATYRLFSGKYPPAKVGIWGDTVDRPDNVFLRWFGMSKANKNNFAQPIYEDYEKTKNIAFFPPAVKPEVNKQKLNTEQFNKLQELVGRSRKSLIAPYINDMARLPGYEKPYSQLSETDKLKSLEILYEQGAKQGESLFIKLYPQFAKDEDIYNPEKELQKMKGEFLRESVENKY